MNNYHLWATPPPIISQSFRRITVFTSAWILLSIFVGAIVRNADSSLNCSYWTSCQVTDWIATAQQLLALSAALLMGVIAAISWRDYRQYRFIVGLALAAFTIGVAQIVVVATLIWTDSYFTMRIAHLFAALFSLGFVVALATIAHLPAKDMVNIGFINYVHRFYFRSIILTGIGLFLLIVTGTIVRGTGTGLACSDWPLCGGEIFPAKFTLGIGLTLLHRFAVMAVAVMVAAVILQTRRRYAGYSLLARLSTVLGLLFLVQVGLGGLYTWSIIPPLVIGIIHLGLTASAWGCLAVMATTCYLTLETRSPLAHESSIKPLPVRQKAITFFKLTKPLILVLLLITTITSMVIAAKGLPSISLILYTFLGGILSAGGASVLNSYIDSDIDLMMSRTSRRATVTGLVTPQETLLFGLSLSTLSFLIFAIFVNLFSAILSTIGILYYVFFYTLYLKRTTIHNIIIGGAAGAIPPLVGWTAVTNSLDLGAFYLFAIIFFWTPPHTWAMALLVKKDYAQARVPMLPVMVGEKDTTYQILLYSILLITLTLLPFTFKMVSWLYLLSALILGARFLYLAWTLWRNYSKSVSKRLYKFSQAYLALLFLIMALDRSLF